MLTKVSFIGIALMAKGAGETGVSWLHLTSKVIFQLGIVGKEAAAGWTGHHLLMCVGSGVLKNFGLVPTMKRAVWVSKKDRHKVLMIMASFQSF